MHVLTRAFVSMTTEADGAAAAGLQVTLVEREGNEPLTDEDRAAFSTIKSFAEVVQVTRSGAHRGWVGVGFSICATDAHLSRVNVLVLRGTRVLPWQH